MKLLQSLRFDEITINYSFLEILKLFAKSLFSVKTKHSYDIEVCLLSYFYIDFANDILYSNCND